MMAGFVAAMIYESQQAPPQQAPSASVDQVAASFHRDRNRQPTPRAPVRRESVSTDPLYQGINQALWIEETAESQIVASFDRAFTTEDLEPERLPADMLMVPMHALVTVGSNTR